MGRIGIFGGTFDPIHYGHIITAQSLIEKRNLEKIIFIPCNISPHKINEKNASPIHRLNMIKLAISDYKNFDYSDYEIVKGDISYTLDTIKELKKYYNEMDLIIGFDNLIKFDTWKEPDKILELANLVVMRRKTDTKTIIKHKYFTKAILVDTPTIEISSTIIRERIAEGLPVDHLLPKKVKDYIFKNGLYRY